MLHAPNVGSIILCRRTFSAHERETLASLRQDKSGNYHVLFRFGSRQFGRSLKTTERSHAESMKGRVEMTLLDIERGRLELPADCDDDTFWQFVLSDGKLASKPKIEKALTLGDLFEWYFGQLPPNAKVPKTLETETLHSEHFLRLLGKPGLRRVRGDHIQHPTLVDMAEQRLARRNSGDHGTATRPCRSLRAVVPPALLCLSAQSSAFGTVPPSRNLIG
jgi:hypothetical protein